MSFNGRINGPLFFSFKLLILRKEGIGKIYGKQKSKEQLLGTFCV